MKSLRQLCAASVLILTLSLPASAGWISTPVTQPPPSPASVGSEEATVGLSLAETALNLLQSVLSLL
jgi:hypothetical protein